MRSESDDLEEYRKHLNYTYGRMIIEEGDGYLFSAADIFEQMNPKAFATGFREFLLNEVENSEPAF